ncbi:hypothetical protein BD779DRAFT_1678370 [Infundibulicybe gibba]|nr:hypothetical protein BD779DRAFT_1678370 [Infundibulicybe gibba]
MGSLEDRITSQIAGALWEWPPAVCGKHTNLISLDNSKRWCMTTYRGLDKLMHTLPAQEHGVRMRMANFFFEQSIHKMSGQLEKMNEIAAVHDVNPRIQARPDTGQDPRRQPDAGVIDSYRHLAPVIDTDQYMGWLRSTVVAKGGKLITARINGDLLQQEDRLLAKYGAQAIAEDIVFIVPRNDRTLILGGLVQPHVHTLDLTINSPEIVRMRDRCNKFVPGLENAELDPRLKADGTRSRIIHSYGQGGSGFTLSFGCAADVLELLSELEKSPYLERASL